MAEQPGDLRTDVSLTRHPRPFESIQAPARSKARQRPPRYRDLLSRRSADELKFNDFGAVCRRDDLGERFNFPQRWTPFSGVAMSTLFENSPQTLTLALNLLDQYCQINDEVPRSDGKPHPLARRLMREFASEMLAPLAGCAWHLPMESISHWVRDRSR